MKKVVIRAVVAALALCVGVQLALAQPVNPEEEKEVLAFIAQVNPSLASRIEKMRAVNPEEFLKVLQGVLGQYREIKRLEVAQPALAKTMVAVIKIEGRIQDLGQQYKQSQNPQEKEKIKTEIKALLNEAFEGKLLLKEAQTRFIENELTQLKAKIAQKRQYKDKIVEKKLMEAISDENLQWD